MKDVATGNWVHLSKISPTEAEFDFPLRTRLKEEGQGALKFQVVPGWMKFDYQVEFRAFSPAQQKSLEDFFHERGLETDDWYGAVIEKDGEVTATSRSLTARFSFEEVDVSRLVEDLFLLLYGQEDFSGLVIEIGDSGSGNPEGGSDGMKDLFYVIQVMEGDTLEVIALNYIVTIEELRKVNQLEPGQEPVVGQLLKIPPVRF